MRDGLHEQTFIKSLADIVCTTRRCKRNKLIYLALISKSMICITLLLVINRSNYKDGNNINAKMMNKKIRVIFWICDECFFLLS